jgi:hypothetical protein
MCLFCIAVRRGTFGPRCLLFSPSELYLKTPLRFILAALSLLATPSLLAQSIATPGYLITDQSDTLRGYLDDEDWAVSPRSVIFRRTADGGAQRFEAAQVRGFVLTERNRWYVSRFVRIGYPIQNVAVDALEKTRFETLHVFLEVVLDSRQASLYQMLDATERERYFVGKGGEFTELIYFKQVLTRDDRAFEAEETMYQSQLTALCQDATNFNRPIPAYTRQALARYLTRYNSCFAAPSLTHDNRSDSRYLFDGWIQGGVFRGRSDDVIDERVSYPSFGFGVRVSFPRSYHNRYAKVVYERIGPVGVLSMIGGLYFGRRAFRPFYQLGLSLVSEGGFPHFALGLSYKRTIHVEVLTPGFGLYPLDGLKTVKLSVGGAIPLPTSRKK